MKFKSIKTTFISRNDNNLRTFFGVISLIVVGLGVMGTFFFASNNNDRRNREINNNLEQISTDVESYITFRKNNYSQLLYSASSIFSIKDVSSNDWKTFAENSKLETSYPDVLALGFTQDLKPDEVNAFTDYMRTNIDENYTVQPSYERSEYTAIKFIEPFNEANRSVMGYDMMTDPLRAQAMKNSRDTSEVSFSNGVVAKQDSDAIGIKPLSVLAYYPIYNGGIIPKTIEDRRANIYGYIYLVVRVGDIFDQEINVLEKNKTNYTLSEVTKNGENNLFKYTSKDFDFKKATRTTSTTINVKGHTWISRVQINASGDTITYSTIFILGIFSSALIGIVSFWILINRFKLVRISHQEEIQKTKDELLALASHQLRTPATAVRQYVGMLKNGYFGEMTSEQSEIINKAFKSNDRQLEIIDQLLYVAKADAGQLAISIKKFDIVPMLNTTYESMKEQIAKKSIKVTIKTPKQLLINADSRYINMILENLLNNAIKYSYEKGKINIDLKKKDNNAILTIKDNGVGINKVDLDKLFQKFSRINNPLSDIEGGTGLGLFLAEKLATAHGGKINVKSNNSAKKHGSIFTLTIPIKSKSIKSVIHLTELNNL